MYPMEQSGLGPTLFAYIFFNNSLFKCKCRLLITFAISLDPDQGQHTVGPDLDPSCWTLWWCSWKNFSKKLILKNISRRQQQTEFSADCKSVKSIIRVIDESTR